MLQLLVTAIVVPSWLILFAVMMEAILSPETSVLTRTPLCHIPEDDILSRHRIENLKSHLVLHSHAQIWAEYFDWGTSNVHCKKMSRVEHTFMR
jgi:hypothetical protein